MLNRIGKIDVVMSADSDVLAFGAQCVIKDLYVTPEGIGRGLLGEHVQDEAVHERSTDEQHRPEHRRLKTAVEIMREREGSLRNP